MMEVENSVGKGTGQLLMLGAVRFLASAVFAVMYGLLVMWAVGTLHHQW
jgi:hypothetical protein